MAYLQAHFPRFAQIVTQAKYDARFADESTGFTLFLSSEWETKSGDVEALTFNSFDFN
jgi:hypothetical protein